MEYPRVCIICLYQLSESPTLAVKVSSAIVGLKTMATVDYFKKSKMMISAPFPASIFKIKKAAHQHLTLS